MKFIVFKTDTTVTPLFKVIEDFIALEGHSLDVLVDPMNTFNLSKGRLNQLGDFIVLVMGIHCYDVYDLATALEACGFRSRNVREEEFCKLAPL